jgi:hypothetical protein
MVSEGGIMNLVRILFFVFITTNAFALDSEEQCIQNATDIRQKLSCLRDVTFADEATDGSTQGFNLQFRQPIDHTRPELGTFQQRVVLLHKSEEEPMVLQTSGYSIFSVARTLISGVFDTNQIQVEHRFFSNSRPAILDWSKLDIKQSADDFHRITVALKKIYTKRWVNTGASKGGMTSIYHRYFYPNDLDGTVADVAPLSFSTNDERYITFIDQVGGEDFRECREKLKNLQITLLRNRPVYEGRLPGNFSQLGSNAVAFEHSVIEMPFYFWQYGNPSGCRNIPVNGDPEASFSFLQQHASINDYTDQELQRFIPYYFQAATQLGNPGNLTAHLEHLRHFVFTIDQYTPRGVEYTYSNQEMLNVDRWVRTDADEIVFVYGTLDPWTAGEFPVSETGKNVKKYYVANGNHGSKFNLLSQTDKQQVLQTLSRWLNKQPVNDANKKMKTLEDFEFEHRKHHRRLL